MTTLTLLEGGRGRPSTARLGELQDAIEEARIELVVARAERVTFTTAVVHHARMATFALVKDRTTDVEYHLTQIQRLAVHEDARARASLSNEPAVAMERAA